MLVSLNAFCLAWERQTKHLRVRRFKLNMVYDITQLITNRKFTLLFAREKVILWQKNASAILLQLQNYIGQHYN